MYCTYDEDELSACLHRTVQSKAADEGHAEAGGHDEGRGSEEDVVIGSSPQHRQVALHVEVRVEPEADRNAAEAKHLHDQPHLHLLDNNAYALHHSSQLLSIGSRGAARLRFTGAIDLPEKQKLLIFYLISDISTANCAV